MQPSIPLGSTLRDRYTVRQILGQGGMGRTYLAEDQERFNEACVLKEFIPANSAPEAVKKAKELFQREASTLYQIKHPQVPDFRATFEATGRLFLVQDYVEGHSFREMLVERRRQRNCFTEAEVTTLLLQVLPILIYLHGRNIIHRDISPENLMLRTSDRLPVLIDFGVVKETATKLISHSGSHAATVVGKLGYAPPEQMQSGRAYANSDLYALAATTIVLLTGREPQDLFDDVSLSWHWQRFANVSPRLAEILNRMLSYKPSDRYSSAEEVLQTLQFAQGSLSEVKTMVAGGQASGDLEMPTKTVYAENSWQSSSTNSVQHKRQGVNIVLAIGLVLISGVASWAIASAFLNRNASTPINTASSTPVVTNINKALEFTAGSNITTANDKIIAGQTITYRLTAKKGQIMTASLTGSGLIMTLIYEDQKPIDSRSANLDIGYWQGKLPATGAYFIIIKTASGTAESNFSLNVQVETNTPIPTAVPTPVITQPSPSTPKPTPTPTEPALISENVNFPPGSVGTTIEALIQPFQTRQYNLNMLAGQTLSVFPDGNIMIEIINPAGETVYSNGFNAPKIKNTQAGSYQINVTSQAETKFKLDITTNTND